MSAPCIDAPCCGCCTLQADTEPPEGLDDVLDDAGDLVGDRILEQQELSDFAREDLPEPDDELGPWDWMTD